MLGKIVNDYQIEQLLISTPRLSEARLAEIVRECEVRNIELKRMSIKIESVTDNLLTSIAQSASESKS